MSVAHEVKQCVFCHRYLMEQIVTCQGCNTAFCLKCKRLHDSIAAGAHK